MWILDDAYITLDQFLIDLYKNSSLPRDNRNEKRMKSTWEIVFSCRKRVTVNEDH